jgi:TonB family protein
VSVSPQKYPDPEAPAGPVPPAGGARVGETLVLLTHDESLIEALATVVPGDGLTVVADESELAHHLFSANAGVAFIDAAALDSRPGMAEQLTLRLHNQLPDVVLVVAGDGVAQTELAGLVTDGTIYRFVHKPVSEQRMKLFVDAAWRKRDGISGASGLFPTLSLPQLPAIEPMRRAVPWPSIGAAAVVIGAVVAWFMLRANSDSGVVPAPTATQTESPAAVAPAAAAVPQPSSSVPAATAAPAFSVRTSNLDRLAMAAELALLSGDLAEATRLTDAARVVDPQHVRVNDLTTQLALEQAREAERQRAIDAAAAPVRIPAVSTTAELPVAESNPATPSATRISSSPEMVGPTSSTPPVSEAKDPLSVAAIILHREYAPDPEFPDVARERDLAGYVDLEFTVNSDGSVAEVAVLKSQPVGIFDKSAVAAVSQWRYRPIARDGVPVSEHARLRLNFGYK